MAKSQITNSAQETQKMAAEFAGQILRHPPLPVRLRANGMGARKPAKHAVVLALQGDLGAGKTTFLQGFAKGLGIKEKVLSPTFIILKRFKIKKTKNQISNIKTTDQKFINFYHIDCYRLNKPREVLDLGFKEIISNPENIVAIEWPEKIKKILPKSTIVITFEHLEKNKRELTIYDKNNILSLDLSHQE